MNPIHLTENPVPVPVLAKALRPEGTVIDMGAPRRTDGTPVPDVATANMMVLPDAHPELGHMFLAYYRPTPAQLLALADGGYIEVAQYGAFVQPFSLAVIADGK